MNPTNQPDADKAAQTKMSIEETKQARFDELWSMRGTRLWTNEEFEEILELGPPYFKKSTLFGLSAKSQAAKEGTPPHMPYPVGNLGPFFLRRLSERNESQSDLAKRWGKSRQYVSQLLNSEDDSTWTIKTMQDLFRLTETNYSIIVSHK